MKNQPKERAPFALDDDPVEPGECCASDTRQLEEHRVSTFSRYCDAHVQASNSLPLRCALHYGARFSSAATVL